MTRTSSRTSAKRPVLYQLCRAGERFEVGDGPVQLGANVLVVGRGDPRRTDEGRVFVDDPWMSSRHAQIMPLDRKGSDANVKQRDGTPGRFVIEDLGSTNGVLVNGVPSARAPLLHGDLVETGRTFWVYVEEPNADALLSEPYELGGVSTWTPWFARELAELLPRVPTADHVLVCGPAGTGKGFFARTIHVVSGRSGRFVHLDCRERRPRRLLVDLFGDDTHAGRFKDADGGTLLLENIDALPLEVQDRLIEVFRRRAFTPEGRAGRSAVVLGARVVASMSSTVEGAVADATLRPGLVDAFQGLVVKMPTLAQRLPDLGLLLDDFLARARGAPAISRDACRAVLRYTFRQHVRAMNRVIEGAATLAGEPDAKAAGGQRGVIEVVHLPVDVVGPDMLRQLLPAPAALPEHTSELAAAATGSDEAAPSDDEQAGQASASTDWAGPDDLTDPSRKRLRPKRKAAAAPPTTAASERPAAMATTGTSGAPNTPPHGVAAPRNVFSQVPDDDEAQVDPERLAAALRAAHGNVSAAARALGRPRAVVLRWIREFGLDVAAR